MDRRAALTVTIKGRHRFIPYWKLEALGIGGKTHRQIEYAPAIRPTIMKPCGNPVSTDEQ
jgi:hypothetical protein